MADVNMPEHRFVPRDLILAPVSAAAAIRRHRYLCVQLARRFFAARHAATALGWLWSLIGVGVQFALFWVVFGHIIGMRAALTPNVSFGVFLMTGLVPYVALHDVVARAADVFRTNAPLVQKVRFPLEVLVVADVLGALAHHALAFTLVAGLSVALVRPPLETLLWLPLAVVTLIVWALGLAAVVSVAGAFFPDMREAVSLVLQVVFYGAPIVYPLSMVGNPALRSVLLANPLTGLVQMVRAGLIGGEGPNLVTVVLLLGCGALLVGGGAALLTAVRAKIPDVI